MTFSCQSVNFLLNTHDPDDIITKGDEDKISFKIRWKANAVEYLQALWTKLSTVAQCVVGID